MGTQCNAHMLDPPGTARCPVFRNLATSLRISCGVQIRPTLCSAHIGVMSEANCKLSTSEMNETTGTTVTFQHVIVSVTRICAMVAMISGHACGARSVQPPGAHAYQLSGTIVTSDSKPAGGSIVIATDPESVDEVAFARADAAGHFVLNSPIPQIG